MNRDKNTSRRCHKKLAYLRSLWSRSAASALRPAASRSSGPRARGKGLFSVHRLRRGRLHIALGSATTDFDTGLMDVLRLAMSAVDPNTALHCDRVAAYLAWFASAVCQDLSEEEVRLLWESGWLHDVGKIGLGAAVLTSSKRLSKDELTSIRAHPERGAQLVSQIPGLRHALPVVLHHHERYDGNGYPHGLMGESIPMVARLASVVDAFDAMTGYRPYRSRASLEVAMQEIIANSGSQFDPLIVNIFVREFHHVRHLYQQLHSDHPPKKWKSPSVAVNPLADALADALAK